MFAELHGGKMALGSTLGEGTTVRITFPASRNLPPMVTFDAAV
jgi:signal transduction histidine kinase